VLVLGALLVLAPLVVIFAQAFSLGHRPLQPPSPAGYVARHLADSGRGADRGANQHDLRDCRRLGDHEIRLSGKAPAHWS
jgi:hypothetical protein